MIKINSILVLFLVASSVVAQSKATVTDGMPISEIISNYSKSSGEDIVLDPRVKGRVRLYGQSLQELSYENLTTILATLGYSSFKSGDLLIIVPSNVTKQNHIELVTEGQHYPLGQMVTDLIELEKLCPYDLVPILRPLVPPTSHFAPIQDPPSLLLTDSYGNTKRIRKILMRMETLLERPQKCVAGLRKIEN